MFRTRGLSHIQLVVDDLDAAATFYGDVFGFEVVHRRSRSLLLQSPGGGGSLAVRLPPDGAPKSPSDFGLSLHDPADLEAVLGLVIGCGGHVISRTEHTVGGASAVIADPDGNRISL